MAKVSGAVCMIFTNSASSRSVVDTAAGNLSNFLKKGRTGRKVRSLGMKMSTITTIIAATVLGVVGDVIATPYIETFDAGDAGWYATTIDDNGRTKTSSVKWSATGGNPDGYISGKLSKKSPKRLYALTPKDVDVYGDMTGLTLTTDYTIDGNITRPDEAMVRFYIGSGTDESNYFVTKDVYSWDPTANTSWVTHQVDLTADNFLIWPNQSSGSKTFANVIANPDDIGLIFTGAASDFEYSESLGFSGKGTVSIDNFGAVPEPATLCMLGIGAIGVILRKYK